MSDSSRPDFFHLRQADGLSADKLSESVFAPTAGSTVHVATTAMACEFAVIMNAGSHDQAHSVSDALQACADVETWLSRYQPDSDLSKVNRNGYKKFVRVCPELFELVQEAIQLCEQTEGAFDIAAGSLIRLWKSCRDANRIPTAEEVAAAKTESGSDFIELAEPELAIRLTSPTVELDPGAIGKGYALDQAAHWMNVLPETPPDYLIHGGHSSLVAVGRHENLNGWPVGIGNPLLTQKRLGTILLRDAAMSTSGSNIQFFRHKGKRYGHILDPRTGWPVQDTLSVTVIAKSALIADVLSTAFFVLGPQQTLKVLDRFPEVGVILIPPPGKGTKIQPIVKGIDQQMLFWDDEQVILEPAE